MRSSANAELCLRLFEVAADGLFAEAKCFGNVMGSSPY